MHLKFRNVNDAFLNVIKGVVDNDIPTITNSSRNGDVLVVPEPMLFTYSHPCERVLFNRARDCNPFFHLYESLWMLAGCNDAKRLGEYNSKITAMASDDGETFNGAYGYRWRHARGSGMFHMDADDDYKWKPCEGAEHDQLAVLIDHLKRKPLSRRAVLQMWNVEDDLLNIDSSKDVCCNLSVMFEMEMDADNAPADQQTIPPVKRLNMTVTNRSNDTILGMLGANYVHFTFLQEYMAAMLGVNVGKYNHFTNNMHFYKKDWRPAEWLNSIHSDSYEITGTEPYPLVKDPAKFDEELCRFLDFFPLKAEIGEFQPHFTEPFFRDVATPMMWAFKAHKECGYGWASCRPEFTVATKDWATAGQVWIDKRKRMYQDRQAKKEE